MNRVTLNGKEYVVVREQHGRDVELVDVSTGLVSWHDPRTLPPRTMHEHYMVPDAMPFPNRDPNFLKELRDRRSRALTENVKQRRARDPNKSTKPKGEHSPRRGSKVDTAINEVVPEHLRAFVKAQMGRKKAS